MLIFNKKSVHVIILLESQKLSAEPIVVPLFLK